MAYCGELAFRDDRPSANADLRLKLHDDIRQVIFYVARYTPLYSDAVRRVLADGDNRKRKFVVK